MFNFKPGLNVIPPGFYGDLKMNGVSGVALAAADPSNPPLFNSFNLRDCHDLNFRNIRFQWVAQPGEPSYTTPNTIDGPSSKINFLDCYRIGSEVDGVPIGRGLLIGQDVTGVTFVRDVAQTWATALINLGNDVKINRSKWFDTSEDIVQSSGTQGFLAEFSLFGFFRMPVGSPVHVDFLQWQHNGAIRVSKDITIRHCHFLSGAGRETAQTIFIKQEDLFKAGALTYQQWITNVSILQNVIYAGHVHGISLDGVDGANVGYNTLLRNPAVITNGFPEATYNPSINIANSKKVKVHHNIAASSPQGKNNLIIQPSDYGKFFVPDVMKPNCPLDRILALPSSVIYVKKLGAALVRPT